MARDDQYCIDQRGMIGRQYQWRAAAQAINGTQIEFVRADAREPLRVQAKASHDSQAAQAPRQPARQQQV